MEHDLKSADVSREWEAEERERIEAELTAAADIDHINRTNEDELSGIWFADDFAR